MAPGRRNLCWHHGRTAVAPAPRSADSLNRDDDTRIEGQSTTPSARRLEPDVAHRTNRSSDRWFLRASRPTRRARPTYGGVAGVCWNGSQTTAAPRRGGASASAGTATWPGWGCRFCTAPGAGLRTAPGARPDLAAWPIWRALARSAPIRRRNPGNCAADATPVPPVATSFPSSLHPALRRNNVAEVVVYRLGLWRWGNRSGRSPARCLPAAPPAQPSLPPPSERRPRNQTVNPAPRPQVPAGTA